MARRLIQRHTAVPRGTVIHLDFGPGDKPEPASEHFAVVVSEEVINRGRTWVVVPLTTYGGKSESGFPPAGEFNVRLRARQGRQPKTCDALCFCVTTVNKLTRHVQIIGQAPADVMQRIDRGLALVLGLAVQASP